MLRIALLSLVLVAVRIVSAASVNIPGYTDAYYYVDVAQRVAHGDGLVADFVWSPLEAPRFEALPIPSNRFWMPLASLAQAAGIGAFGDRLGAFRAAQLIVLLFAAFVPLATYASARALGANEGWSLVAAALAGLGGLFAPAWVTLDSYGIAALLGAAFFLLFARATKGDARAGALAGLAVGLLFLARAEAALLGLALLTLARGAETRRAGIAGSAVALAVGLGWLARNIVVGGTADVFARSALLVHYEDFFALRGPSLDAFIAAGPAVLGAKIAALGTNAVTFVFAFALLPVAGIVAGARASWGRPEVRAYVLLAGAVFVAQSILWTLHSTRGSYVHSLAAFLPFGFAIAGVGGQALFSAAPIGVRALAIAAALVMTGVISFVAVAQFDATFGATERARRSALDAIPAGPFLAVDAAAWRWIAGRPVVVTPADGPAVAGCAAARYGARALILEATHFSAYDDLYRGGPRPTWLGAPVDRGDIRVFPVVGDIGCSVAQ